MKTVLIIVALAVAIETLFWVVSWIFMPQLRELSEKGKPAEPDRKSLVKPPAGSVIRAESRTAQSAN